MKKKKLSLNKVTIASLDRNSQLKIKGGEPSVQELCETGIAGCGGGGVNTTDGGASCINTCYECPDTDITRYGFGCMMSIAVGCNP